MRHLPLLRAFALTAVMMATPHALADDTLTRTFEHPIDALSVALASRDARVDVSAKGPNGRWGDWTTLRLEDEQDPLTRESNLVIFDEAVREVRLRGDVAGIALHPIRVSASPVTTLVAATSGVGGNRVISRSGWGANDELLYVSHASSSSAAATSASSDAVQGEPAPEARIDDCEQAQKDHPQEFKVARTEKVDRNGKTLRWARQYSKEIKLIAVHHTAAAVGGDARSGAERVRAIYEYHAKSRGWGDVGYHYLIDEDGKIYEGRSGGRRVVAGHAYCNNIGTLGVALLGNFEVEKPSQAQMKSLQWLLDTLTREEGIDPSRDVTFHGKTLSPIVGHRDLLSTDCPGHYAYKVLGQVRTNVIRGDLTKSVKFPSAPKKTPSSKASSSRGRAGSASPATDEGVTAMGETTLSGRPGTQVLLTVRYQNGDAVGKKGTKIASVVRSDPTIGLWQDVGGAFERVRDALVLPAALAPDGTVALRLKAQFPQAEGSYAFHINGLRFTLDAKGRSLPTPRGQTTPAENLPRPPRHQPLPLKSSSASASSPSTSATSGKAPRIRLSKKTIRIRLTRVGESATVLLPADSLVGKEKTGGNVFLFRDKDACVAAVGKERVASGIVRLVPADSGASEILSVTEGPNRYRGALECRIDGGELIVVNELPLEDYLAGLAEEPDSEPWEKQRAFAIAARTYAAYYMDPANRKFPGRGYDGSDSPAEFQAYGGVEFEEGNPRWTEAARDTAAEVLAVGSMIIRAPYFSASDGRTLSPEEAGWNDFPFAEIFSSKKDPWCKGMARRGHGVGMSGCGAEGQAEQGRTAEQILGYYYPGAMIGKIVR
jgi:hypothetical protein